jgi:hypothetical protein
MNMPEIFFSAANTILLVVLFFYQRNRNKVLEDQLGAQRQLLDETKSVVLQQASAIEGQSKVVDTALKYTSAFDPKKLEELIRREIMLEHREQVESLKRRVEATTSSSPTDTQKLTTALINAAAESAYSFIKPLTPFVVRAVLLIPAANRAEALKEVDPSIRDTILKVVTEVETKMIRTVL